MDAIRDEIIEILNVKMLEKYVRWMNQITLIIII